MTKKYISSKTIKFLAISAVCISLVFLNPKGFFSPIRIVFLKVAYPFQKTSYLLSRTVGGTFEFLGSISDLKKENAKLIKENDVLSSEVVELQTEKKENETLREQLNLAPKGKFNLEAAFVISQNPEGQTNWIMIDKGSSDGIAVDMPVIVSEGILVGKVTEVFSGSSRITLLTDSESAINAMDLETNAKGIVKGEYGLGIMMDMVAQSDVLNDGDAIVTSGLGSSIPRGLLIGKIQNFHSSSDKLFQQATINPRVKYADLSIVFVIKENK